MKPERLLRLYPRAWRERYGVEFQALVEARRLSPRDSLDIARLGVSEWLNTGFAVPVIAIAVAQGSLIAGDLLRARWVIPSVAQIAFGVLMIAWLLVLLYRGFLEGRRFVRGRPVGSDQIWPERTVRLLVILAFIVGTLHAWAGIDQAVLGFGGVPRWLAAPTFMIALLSLGWSARAADRQRQSWERLQRMSTKRRLSVTIRPLGLS